MRQPYEGQLDAHVFGAAGHAGLISSADLGRPLLAAGDAPTVMSPR